MLNPVKSSRAGGFPIADCGFQIGECEEAVTQTVSLRTALFSLQARLNAPATHCDRGRPAALSAQRESFYVVYFVLIVYFVDRF